MAGSYTGDSFNTSPDSSSGTLITLACFAAGVRIATAGGEIPVETLRAGDRVRSMFGGSMPVIWVGRRHLDCRRHRRPEEVWPVRIAAHAFAPGQPHHDVLVSPDHAVLAGGVLIPVRALINGTTVVQDPGRYRHLFPP